jgi:hypothetical protein
MHPATKQKNADFLRFFRDTEILKEVKKYSRENIKSARKLNGGETVLTEDELNDELQSSVLHGVERAWVYRFLTEIQGIEPQKFFSKRRNKLEDYDEVLKAFPSFKEFIPNTPITNEEVIKCACEELASFLLGKGSDWHQSKLYAAFKIPVFTDATLQTAGMRLRDTFIGPLKSTLISELELPLESPLSQQSYAFSPTVISYCVLSNNDLWVDSYYLLGVCPIRL